MKDLNDLIVHNSDDSDKVCRVYNLIKKCFKIDALGNTDWSDLEKGSSQLFALAIIGCRH